MGRRGWPRAAGGARQPQRVRRARSRHAPATAPRRARPPSPRAAPMCRDAVPPDVTFGVYRPETRSHGMSRPWEVAGREERGARGSAVSRASDARQMLLGFLMAAGRSGGGALFPACSPETCRFARARALEARCAVRARARGPHARRAASAPDWRAAQAGDWRVRKRGGITRADITSTTCARCAAASQTWSQGPCDTSASGSRRGWGAESARVDSYGRHPLA